LAEADATLLALAVAMIWAVHPLLTEAVTYISQRAESLMGLFYLLTLYCFVRSVEARGRSPESGSLPNSAFSFQPSVLPVLRSLGEGGWRAASILSCLLGTLTKEIIVTAPVMVLLYDRTFVAGSFREACRLRWRYYLGLAATWLLLAHQMHGLGLQSVGFDQGVTWWSYALTSCRSLVLYCKMALWPHPLVFDYGANFIQHAGEAAPYALVLMALLAAVMVAWRYQPAIGFAGAWFFVILAPTSSVVPVALQPMADHRLYLSLAAVVALGVLGLYRLIGRRAMVVYTAAAVGLGCLSVQRNRDYGSALAIWSDTVAKSPDNVRARYNLGNALLDLPGRSPDAIAQFQTAVRIKPDDAQAYFNLGNAFHTAGQIPEAIAEYEQALRLKPDYAEVHNNFGSALLIKFPGRLPEAIGHFEAALRLKPDYAEAHYNFGIALANAGRIPEAIAQYKEAVRLVPNYAPARTALEQLQATAR
jgi:tetratricopeptide (TPR) repeat protein